MADIVYPGKESGTALNSGDMPINQDLLIYKGDYVEFYVTIKDSAGVPISLAGQTPAAQLRKNYTDESPVDFVCSTFGSQVRIYLPSAVSATLDPSSSYIWDFQLTNASSETKTYLTGDVTVYNEVTR